MSDSHRHGDDPVGRIVAILVAMALVGCAVALWQLAADKGSQHHQSAGYEQGSTSQLPAHGRVGSPTQAPNPTEHRNDADQPVGPGTWPDWAIVGFTLMLTLLGWLQYRLDRRTASETKDALKIARINADAATALAAAATESNKLTRDLFLEQYRPRIVPTAVMLQEAAVQADGALSLLIRVLARNSGNVPGSDASAHLKAAPFTPAVAPFPIILSLVLEVYDKTSKGWALARSLAVGEEAQLFVAPVVISATEIGAFVEKNASTISLAGVVTYNYSSPVVWKHSTCWAIITYTGDRRSLLTPGSLSPANFTIEMVPMLATQT